MPPGYPVVVVNDNSLVVLNNYLGYGGQRSSASVRYQGAGRPARKGPAMGDPVVHFEITGTDPQLLRRYYGELFGWKFDTSGPVSPAVSEPGNYGFTDGNTTSDGVGIRGGIGGG